MELGSKSLFSKKDRLQEWALRTIEFCINGGNRKPYHELKILYRLKIYIRGEIKVVEIKVVKIKVESCRNKS